jgi:hypothetical protein
MTGNKANHSIQKSESVEQAVMQMEEDLRVAISKGDAKVYARIVGDDKIYVKRQGRWQLVATQSTNIP